MSLSFRGHPSIPGSPDLSRSSLPGHYRTSSARPSESRPSQCSSSHIECMPHTDAHHTPYAENEALTTSSPGSRLARHSTLSPGPRSYPITPLHSAIPDQYLPYTTRDQHAVRVPDILNLRPTSHHPGLPINPAHPILSPVVLESSELSSSSSRHAAINSHSERPRTSNQVFSNISDLAAHYGIPQFLPIAPRTTPRRKDFEEPSSSLQTDTFSSSADFENLCSNYLNMLSQQPGDGAATDVQADDPSPAGITITAPAEEVVRSIMDVLNATPELQTSNDLNEYLTSPLIDSPFDDDLLDTPAVGCDMDADIMTSPLMGDFGGGDSFGEFSSLFGNFSDAMYHKPPEDELLPLPQQSNLFTMESPITPLIDLPTTSPSGEASVPSKRKSNVTGTRKNITPQSLVPIDAPTQTRKYLTPSATSRKELPATWRRKRLRVAGADEVDQLVEDGPAPTVSEQQQIEAKRRQNTIAARRSRKRKLEYQQELEDRAERSKQESEMWKQRCLTYRALLRSHHIECPDFPDS